MESSLLIEIAIKLLAMIWSLELRVANFYEQGEYICH